MSSWSFLIMAAGKGSRLGGVSKQLRPLGDRPVWRWSFDVARDLFFNKKIDEVILTIPSDGDPDDYLLYEDLSIPVKVIKGGATRSLSVRNALESAKSDRVLIHDGARPFLPLEMCERIMSGVTEDTGAIPILPVADALKAIDNVEGTVKSVDRSSLRLTQTPQGFPRRTLLEILNKMPSEQSDEAEPWLVSGKKLAMVEGDRLNFKITDKGDWDMALSLASQRPKITRTGIGYDIHPLIPNRPLILGGVLIKSELGLAGHSDADIICHSVSDAILGAVGLPDIGIRYPASDQKYKGANSAFLLESIVNEVEASGWDIEWIDVVLSAQYPRIGSTVNEIISSLESILGKGKGKIVNLKIKSGELIPPVGSADCMTCYCVATMSKTQKGLHNSPFPL